MKNNYSSIQNVNKTATTVKQFFIAIVLVASASFNNAFGQVNIIAPSLTVTGCSFPTLYSNLGNIVIRETTIGSIGPSGSVVTLTLSAPNGFEFSPSTGAVGATPGDITVASMVVSSNNLVVSLTGATASNMDTITISNLKVRGVSGATGVSNITRTGGTATIDGDINGTVHASLTSVLNNVTGGFISTPQTICYNGDPAAFTETGATGSGPLTYEWKDNTDGYIATLSNTPTYDIPPGLTSPTTYRRITTSTLNGLACYANSNDVTITITPTVLSGTNSASQTICSGATPIALTGGTASGGDSVYNYLWQESTTNSTTGFTVATNTNTASDYWPPPLTATTWYRRIVTSAGCQSNDTTALKMTVNPIPLLTSALADTACSGTPFNYNPTSQVIGATFVWSRAVATGISNAAASGTNNPNETLINTTANPEFVYYLYTVSANGCTNATPASLAVTVNTSPELSSDTALLPICSNTIFDYTPTSSTTGASFTWTRAALAGISNPAASGNDSVSETLINTTSAPITVTYVFIISANGCSNNQNVLVTVNPTPLLSSSLSEIICSDVEFNYTPTTLPIGSTINWARSATAGIINPSATGTDSIVETLTDTTNAAIIVSYRFTIASNGCSNEDTLFLKVNPAPVVTNSATDTICSGLSPNISLTANLPSTFAWTIGEISGGITGASVDNGSIINQNLTNPDNTLPGSVQYQIIATSTSESCAGTNLALFVTVNPKPMGNSGSTQIMCSDSSVILGGSPTGSGGTGPYTYSWSPSTGLDNAALSNPTANPTSTTSYTVTVTDSVGCVAAPGAVLVTVNPAPPVGAGTDVSICIGNNITLYASGGTTYLWSNGSSADSITVNPSVNTSYNVMGTTNGCSHSDTVLVTVNSIPVVNGGTDTVICAGQSILLSGSGNGSPYSWNNGISDGISFTPTTTTTYVVSGTLNGCSQYDTVLVTVNSLPTVNGGLDTIICAGQSIILSATGNGFPYSWNNGISNSVSFTPTATTTYVVSGTLNGCSQYDTVLVTVNSIPNVNGGSDTTICAGQSTKLTANGNANSYTWDNGVTNGIPFTPSITNSYVVAGTSNGCSQYDTVLVTVNPIPSVNGGTDTTICAGQITKVTANGNANSYIWNNGVTNGVPFTPSITNSYVVNGTLNGCSQYDTVLVTVNSIPNVNGGSDTIICAGQSTVLSGNGNGAPYTWDNGVSDGVSFNATVTTTYVVSGTLNGCSQFDTVLITVNPAPLANAGSDHTICIGDTATLAGLGGITFVWTDGINSFNTPTILVNPIASTQYTLTVTDNSGCTDSDTAMVYVTASKDIYGHASYSGGPVTNGMAVLYKYVQFQTRFDSVQYVPLNPSTGDYVFTNVNYGEYLVKVVVDSAIYPTLINTYYGDEFLWDGDSVMVINHTCNANTLLDNVTMVEFTDSLGGIGLIIGQIIEGISFGRVEGEPIPGVDIYLGKNPGGIVATSNTNSTGHFTFSGVADGNYTIYVDIPGLGRDSSYTFTVDSTNNQFLNQNYIADSTSVFPNPTSTVGISNLTKIFENKFSVYPNPVKGNTTIEYTIQKLTESKITLEIYTILGVKISTLVNASQQAGLYKYNFNSQNNNLNSGVYLISLCIDGQTSTKRIVVME